MKVFIEMRKIVLLKKIGKENRSQTLQILIFQSTKQISFVHPAKIAVYKIIIQSKENL